MYIYILISTQNDTSDTSQARVSFQVMCRLATKLKHKIKYYVIIRE